MLRVLNVAEKNDASRSIAELLSHGRYKRREGFSVYNKIYEFEYILDQRPCQMLFTSVSGHLFNLEFKDIPKGWTNYPVIGLFDAEVEKGCLKQMEPILRTLQSEVRGCHMLIIWTDCDREGENIGYEIIEACSAVRHHLKVFRARFSEITSSAVTYAISHLSEPDSKLSEAVDCRMELDLRIGAAFTRFQTLRFQRIFADKLKDRMISYGSCQFPTLGFVVERYKEHTDFIPEPFWKLVARVTKDGKLTEFRWGRGKLFDQQCVDALQVWCSERPQAVVEDVSRKRKTRWRPQALDTIELEKLCSRKLHMSVKQVMRVAENLYSKGYISYPRTETNFFPKGFDLNSLVQMQVCDGTWGEFASQLLRDGVTPRNGHKTDNAHPPIHPIRYAKPDELHGDDKRVYEFVVRHFLACLSKDAEGFETTVRIDINGEKFFVSGLVIIAKNYLEVYCYERWNATEVPMFELNERFEATISVEEGRSTAPPLLTEADLVALMEKHGIGTDATHSEHIETIKQRLYVGLINEGRFVPGYLGLGLVEGYDSFGFGLSKPKLRASLEADLKEICEGRGERRVTVARQVRIYKQIFERVAAAAQKLDMALAKYFGPPSSADVLPPLFRTACCKCPSCNGYMMLRCSQASKYFIGCSNFPNCKEAIWFSNAVATAVISDQLCASCEMLECYQVRFTFRTTYTALPRTYTGCVLCDPQLQIWLDLTISDSFRARTLTTAHPTTTNASASISTAPREPLRSNNNLPTSCSSTSAIVTMERTSQYFSEQSSSTSLPHRYPLCNCGVECQKLQCRHGPNTGREFYKCNMPSKCSFFKWCDEADVPGDGQQQPKQQRSLTPNANPIVCNCGLDSPCLTVRKEGPNKGRMFYACPKRENKCRFFLWADRPPSSISSNDENNLSLTSASQRIPIRTDVEPVRRRPAVAANPSLSSLRVANGSSVQIIGMFPADVRPFGPSGSHRRAQKRSSEQFASSSSSSVGPSYRRKRKCGVCRQEGHTSKTCPNKFLD